MNKHSFDFPADSPEWADVMDPILRPTRAHYAAVSGYLPVGFKLWNLADVAGNTVAHIAAYKGCLPIDFNQWDMANEDGETVAHTAAWSLHLPDDFNQWGLLDPDGKTVAEVALQNEFTPQNICAAARKFLEELNGIAPLYLFDLPRDKQHLVRARHDEIIAAKF
jgi:hypothetical protein